MRAGVRHQVGDAESIRRQNRGLVLEALRRQGALPRTRLAAETGLSHATITTITNGLIEQGILAEQESPPDEGAKGRGRPARGIGFCRAAAFALIVEITVGRARFSLVDSIGTVTDRLEDALDYTRPEPTIGGLLARRIAQLHTRNPEAMALLARVAVSVQGVLDRAGATLLWSPVHGLAGLPLVALIAESAGAPVALHKRSGLMADGIRWLYPRFATESVATIFIGSTVSMGMTQQGRPLGRGDNAATEFGHMNHIPEGALCRCGRRGCIEAYVADYGVLRSAYGVPDKSAPARHVPAAAYGEIMTRARQGDRNAIHAFNIAGQAIGYGMARLMTVFDPTRVVLTGPGAAAFDLLEKSLLEGIEASLIATVAGVPEITIHPDADEAVFRGIAMKTLADIDWNVFAPLAGSARVGAAAAS